MEMREKCTLRVRTKWSTLSAVQQTWLSEDFIQKPGFQGKTARFPQQCQSRDTAQNNFQGTASGCPLQLCSGVRCPPLALLAGWRKVAQMLGDYQTSGQETRSYRISMCGFQWYKGLLEATVCVAVSGLQLCSC